jgi:hypothetical protein
MFLSTQTMDHLTDSGNFEMSAQSRTWYSNMIRGYQTSSGKWTLSLGNFLTMGQEFSMASLWTWNSRRSGKLRLLFMLLLLHCWAQYFRYTLEISYDFFEFFCFPAFRATVITHRVNQQLQIDNNPLSLCSAPTSFGLNTAVLREVSNRQIKQWWILLKMCTCGVQNK